MSDTSCLICGHRLQAMFSTFCLSKYGKMLTYSLYK
uniref:Rad50 zinc hook motif n=1 Tax=Myoviridae sp. ct3wi9 TaxID=2826610 RepID=A0A8S5MW66_9CAUD|nr:MAG TPA: Rad50 zinc hook motif [Myoviridae sp. ct3wi9]DAI04985.1 MAG TPA: Rad50 zinc hook motif [Caudoviricetes sp.]DAR61573.1 MAG TPA: Rad50 zinc hook motif [Bacteriophage sp.]